LTGISFIDNITGGGKRGELWVWGGYTGEGKTQMAKEIAYRVCTCYGKNVLFVSLEMTVEEMKCSVETRHVHKFVPGGLLAKRIELGTLSKEEKVIYYKALSDWNKNKKYGRFYLWSPPYGCTVDNLALKIEQVQYMMNIDLVIMLGCCT